MKYLEISQSFFRSLATAMPLPSLVARGGGSTSKSSVFASGAAATGDGYSAQVAKHVLADGGNAVDAAVATAFALAVTYPEAGNIGGGGFMTIYMGGKPYFLDYRETAPAATSKSFYLRFKDSSGKQDANSSVWGAQAVAVPGTIAGLWAAHQRFGTLPWSRLIAPAIAYARDGYLPAKEAIEWRDFVLSAFTSAPYPANLTEYFGKMDVNATFKQPELAATLQRISDKGADEFYFGKTADLLVSAMKQDNGNGVITKADLATYKPVWRDPLSFQWNGMTLLTAPPPSSGGVALAQLLGMKSNLSNTLFSGVSVNSPQYMHLNAEMMKRVFADRATHMGDPDFVSVPVAGLTDPAYIASRATEVNPIAITPTDNARLGAAKLHTIHLSIVDKQGNAVSNTFTLNNPYGSGVVVRGAGFALNDAMDDFATVPGQPNSLGVVGGDANEVTPGKRPLSSMTPTILLKDDLPIVVIGTPGGSRIFTALYQVLTNMFGYGMDVGPAVTNRRFHHQLPQGTVMEEEPFSPIPADVAKDLVARGYSVTTNWFDTDVQAIQIKNKTPMPFSDPRARGQAVTAP